MVPLLPPLWAVHIADSQLTFTWCAGGFVLAGLLTLWGAWRIREEEIPQLAMMTAVFFITALIHVPVPGGPRTHLLLNGLLGVVLGRRAMLAIVVGLFLQSATSVMEGVGFSTLGVNACVMGIPALVAWGLFAGLHRLPWIRHPLFRGGLIAFSVFVFILSLCYAVTVLVFSYTAGNNNLKLWDPVWLPYLPLTLAAACLFAVAAALGELLLKHAVEFPLGLFIGEMAVLLTILLNGLALLFGGMENWTGLVLLTFVTHLPLAIVEGIILGFTVGFLARVKPQLLYGYQRPKRLISPAPALPSAPLGKLLAFLLVPMLSLTVVNPASAHHLEADYRVLSDQRIQIESWFDITGDSANGAKVVVFHADGQTLTSGTTDAKGLFVFHYERAESLTVKVDAGMGHAKQLSIPETELLGTPNAPAPAKEADSFANRESHFQFRDILIAFGFIFGLAAFVLALRHNRSLRELKQELEKQRSAQGIVCQDSENPPNQRIHPPTS